MISTIDMRTLRQLNLFSKITRVNTKYCFEYNNTIFFAVPKRLVNKALGEDLKNLNKIRSILNKRVKIIGEPKTIKDAKPFIEKISGATINELKVDGDSIVVDATRTNKATLIGREKRRLKEMKKIIGTFFNKDFVVA